MRTVKEEKMSLKTRLQTAKYLLGLCSAVSLAVSLAVFFGGSPVSAALFSQQEEHHVIADPRTGLALFGYDPVAYHSDSAAFVGSKDHEVMYGGLIWRFRSSANMTAFEADPLAYIPTFGGHDGASVSDGVLAKGDPETFVLAAGKVVFFRSAHNRDRFAAESDMRQRARQSWPEVVRQHAAH
jgi:hypothetical protein